jgi:hypothetical protein
VTGQGFPFSTRIASAQPCRQARIRVQRVWLALLFAVGVVAGALAPSVVLADPSAPSKAKVHGISLSGRVSRVDAAAMTFSVVDSSGREVTVAWTAATKVTGGEVKPGEMVTLRYLDKDKKHIATTIRVGAVAPDNGAPAAPTKAAAAPSAAPRSPVPAPSPVASPPRR